MTSTNKYIITTIIKIIIAAIISIFIIIQLFPLLSVKPVINNNHKIDSLNNIIKENNIIISKNKHTIDSLSNHKSQIINNYATTIENYSNPTIVSDDSISRYISKELYNWK